MNEGGARVPPRFVPTLTEVVQVPADASPPSAVQDVEREQPSAEPAVAVATPPVPPAATALEQLEDQLIHRVMQRVDVALERNLHEAVSAMVLQHTHALVPRLREEIEFVVRQAVADAVARELAERAHF